MAYPLNRPRRRIWMWAVLVVCGYTGLALAAAAQVPGGFSLDTSEPIEVSANELEVRAEDNTAIFSGAVEAVQGDLSLSANEVRVYYRRAGEADDNLITRIDANGAVTLKTPEETAEGDWAIYDVDQKIVTLGGSVQIQRGENLLKGQRLVVDLSGGPTRLDGAGPGEDRVRGRFKPAGEPTDGSGGDAQ